jgi:hypothetical protein
MTTNPLTTVGLMLTLASIVGSFFYIHLSQWHRDLMALRQNTKLNRLSGDECRVEYTKLATWHTYVVNFMVIAFVVFVLLDGLAMIENAKTDPLYVYVWLAFIVFLIHFLFLSLGLTLFGYQNAQEIRNMLRQAGPRSRT